MLDIFCLSISFNFPLFAPLFCAQEADIYDLYLQGPFPSGFIKMGDTSRKLGWGEEQRWDTVLSLFLSIRGWQDLFLLMPSDSPGAVGLVGLSNCAFPFKPWHRVIYPESDHIFIFLL